MRRSAPVWLVVGSIPVLSGALGAVAVNTGVAVRYAAVDRADNVESIWFAAAACLGGATVAVLSALGTRVWRRCPSRWRWTAVPGVVTGALLWQAVPRPPAEALMVGLLLLFASPFVLVGGVVAAILVVAGWVERGVARPL